MADPQSDDKPLGERSPADLVRRGGPSRYKLAKEGSLWVVALLAAGAGAIGMQVKGTWLWSIAVFAMVLSVLMLVRSQVLKSLRARAAGQAAEELAAEQRARELAAEYRREEKAARKKDTGGRTHKPRANPYRKKDA